MLRMTEARDCGNAGIANGGPAKMLCDRMEAHPQRDLFFLENVQSYQHLADQVPEQSLPMAAQECQLSFQGVRRSQSRRAQQVDQILITGAESGSGIEILV